MPRFAPDNYPVNLALHTRFAALCAQLGHSTIEVALAWVLHQAPHIVAIPGTTQIKHLHENLGAADVRLGADTLAQLNALFTPSAARGGRYNAIGTAEVDTEMF